MKVPAPAAATITVRETLNLLDGPFSTFAEGIAEDRYAFWLGSGISLGRIDGLERIVSRIVEFLRRRVCARDPDCRFRKALEDVLRLAQLSEHEWQRVDFAQPFNDWPYADAITGRLIGNYARVLDTAVDGETEDYLLWEGVDIVGTFANPAIEPDVEHFCIAILVLEGVSSSIVSANWDGLIERAVDSLNGGQAAVVVCVRPEEVREHGLRARLFKFHGCAVKAAADEATYRSCLVGRQSQINGWVAKNADMVYRLVGLITSKPTLMMGLSAQDANIQAIFAQAEATMHWPWPGDRPSYVFSEDTIGVDQQSLLRNVYRAHYTPATRQQISDSALIRAYAKPLLIALVLHVLCSKLRRLIDLAPGVLSPSDRRHLQEGLIALRDMLAATVEPDQLGFVQALVEQSGRAITSFRDGRAPDVPWRYNPVTPAPLQQIAGDVALPASGLREVAIAAGILGAGASAGDWTLEAVDADDPEAGVIRINSAAGSAKMFFAANSHVALRLQHNGHLVDCDDAVLIHSLEIAPTMPRSPRGAPGRTGRLGLREVSIAALLEETTNSNELIQRFREEVAI